MCVRACICLLGGALHGCMVLNLKLVYLWVLMLCRICVCTGVHPGTCAYTCTRCVLCFIVVTVWRECVLGPALWAHCTKDLFVLPGGIWLSVWAAPQSAGPYAQPPALSVHTHARTHAPHQPCLNWIITDTHEHRHTHTHHQHPGKADL